VDRSSIQFAATPDGASIAYWTVGNGPPIVVIHNFVLSHADLEWEVPAFRTFYEALGRHQQVIRFDPRSTGLSTGDRPDDDARFLEQVAGDVEAVVDALGHSEYDLMATLTMAPVGIRLATGDRVRRLVLCEPPVDIHNAAEFYGYLQSHGAMAEVNVERAARVMSHVWTDGMGPQNRGPITALVEANAIRDDAATEVDWNATDWLPDVSSPTLILFAKDSTVASPGQIRHAAVTIPDAQLLRLDGLWAPYMTTREETLAALGEFLGWRSAASPATSDLSVIVFTDIVASTEVLDRLGDEAARNAVRSVEDLVTTAATERGGTVIKHLGDGSLLEFASASSALDFTRKVQTEMAGGNLGLRIGMAAGEPIREEGDVHGTVVVMASRIADGARAGEILVSDGVRQLAAGKGFEFDDQGEMALKGIAEPLRVWRLQG
jgi:class 3 adenylate cyclase